MANSMAIQGPAPGIAALTRGAMLNSIASSVPSRPQTIPRLTPKLGPMPHLMDGTMASTRIPHMPQYFNVEEK